MKRKSLTFILLSLFLIFTVSAFVSCTAVSVNVTYDANGGTFSNGESMLTVSKLTNTSLVEPTSPTRAGYVFAGWAKTIEGNELWNFFSDRVSGELTLYAVWQATEAKLVSLSGGVITDNEVSVSVDLTLNSLNLSDMVTVSDYASWVLSRDSAGDEVVDNKIATDLTVGENVYYIIVSSKDGVAKETYTLKITRNNTVDIVLNPDGGSLAEYVKTVTHGESFTLPVPTLAKHIFLGWMANDVYVTDEDGMSLDVSDFTTAVTLMAAWQRVSCDVTFDANGGEFSDNSETLVLDNPIDDLITAPTEPTRTGYIFIGWAKTEGDSDFWDFTTDLVSVDTTLYAVWQAAEAKITAVDGGVLTGSEINLSVALSTNSLNLSNKITVSAAASWILSTDSEGVSVITDKTATELLPGVNTYYITVTAKDGAESEIYTLKITKSNSVGVVLDANGGVLTDTEKTIVYGESFTLPVPTREGHTFLGWKQDSAFITDATGTSLAASEITESVTLVADWQKNSYTVTVSSDNSSEGSVSGGGQYEYGATATVTAIANQGYSFLGWYDGDDVRVSGNASYSFTVSGSVTLVAKFEESSNNGGSGQIPGWEGDNNGWTQS